MSRLLTSLFLFLLLPELHAATLPAQLTINGDVWRVVVVKKMHGWEGQTHCLGHTITILKAGESAMAETLMHELFHALTCDGAEVNNALYNNLNDDHRGIYWASPRWLRLLHDNPDLLKYIHDVQP